MCGTSMWHEPAIAPMFGLARARCFLSNLQSLRFYCAACEGGLVITLLYPLRAVADAVYVAVLVPVFLGEFLAVSALACHVGLDSGVGLSIQIRWNRLVDSISNRKD